MAEEIRAEVTIETNEGDKTYEMVAKTPYEIEDCEKGKLVVLIGRDGSQWSGIFNSCDDEDVVISAIDEPSRKIAFPLDGIDVYFEEIGEIPYAEEIDDTEE